MTLAVLMMAGCKKDPVRQDGSDTENEPENVNIEDYPEAILGQWDAVLDKCYEAYTEDDGYQEITYANEWSNELALNFKTDGKVTYRAKVSGGIDEWDDTYSVKGDTLVWDVREYKINKLNSKELVIQCDIIETHTTSGGTIRETGLTKHWELKR